ncbi:hypothetical protein DB30_03115 [Enhygromyxa salina]|uniref:eCIS core domain-containing protein n=1 Tax=Enhygromyxa salina TaxID=215803 RepID=A0A0C1ZLH1_9BACT|nr:hypothetical protein DB30_03115 [Enhygromyxa salina]
MSCESDESDEEKLRRSPHESGGSAPIVTPDMTARIASARAGGGKALPASARSYFEPRFNVDFGRVRVHQDPKASSLSNKLGARAFTVGRDIFFGAGQLDYNSDRGRHLVAHELTHTIQQTGTPPASARWTAPMRTSVEHELFGPRGRSGHHLIAHDMTHTLHQRQLGPSLQLAKISKKKPPTLVVEEGLADPNRRYSLEVRHKDTMLAVAKRARARMPALAARVPDTDLAKALIVLNQDHLGLDGDATQGFVLSFWFQGTRVGLPASPAPRPMQDSEIDARGAIEFNTIAVALDEWSNLGLEPGLLNLRAAKRPKLNAQTIEQQAARIAGLGDVESIAKELVRLAEHPDLLRPIIVPVWAQLHALDQLGLANAFFTQISEPAFNRLATHPVGLEIIDLVAKLASPRASGKLRTLGVFPIGMHNPIITSCSVGGGNTCMNKLFKELAVMYGSDVAGTYFQRQGVHLADIEKKRNLDDRQQRERADLQKTIAAGNASPADLAALDAKHAAMTVTGKLRVPHIAEFMQRTGTATEGKKFRMSNEDCANALTQVEPCVKTMFKDWKADKVPDHFELDAGKSPGWDKADGKVDPFDYMDKAMYGRQPGLFFFPLGVVAHHSAMIVGVRVASRELETEVEGEDGKKQAVKFQSSAFGGSTAYFFLDQFNDNLEAENELSRTNGNLQSMLYHFTIKKGWNEMLRCDEHVNLRREDFEGRRKGDPDLCADSDPGEVRQGCTANKRCQMINDSMIWQMLPAHDLVIDKQA